MPSSTAARAADTASSMRCFFSLSSTSVAAPTLMTTTPPDSLARRSLELLTVPVRVGVLDLALDLLDAGFDIALGARAVDDGRVVLGDDDLAGTTEHVEGDVLELEADLLGDDCATGEDGDVLEHGLAPLTEPGSLDGRTKLKVPRILLTTRVASASPSTSSDEDQDRLAGLHDLLENREQVVDRS
jgi:hypothetical protein